MAFGLTRPKRGRIQVAFPLYSPSLMPLRVPPLFIMVPVFPFSSSSCWEFCRRNTEKVKDCKLLQIIRKAKETQLQDRY